MKILFIIPDYDHYISHFPSPIAYLISFINRNNDFDIFILNQDVYHFPDSYITDYINKNKIDITAISSMSGYYQYKRLSEICTAIRKSNHKSNLVLGGHGPSAEPAFYLKKTSADYVVLGEGEVAFQNLVNALSNNQSTKNIKGIAYYDGEKYTVNEREKQIKNIDKIPFPAWDLFPINHYALNHNMVGKAISRTKRCMPIISSRGCLYRCNFCYRLYKGYRVRSPESIVEEIQVLKKNYWINHITFFDELLMSTEDRITEVCENFLKNDLNITFDCQGRLNTAKPKLLKLMKSAGCVSINYGIESLDQNVLDKMNKNQTVKEIVKGVKSTIDADIHPGLNFIFGNIGDTSESIEKALSFMLEHHTFYRNWSISPVTPFPGTKLFQKAIEMGAIKDVEDFYKKHTNTDLLTVNFTEMTDDEIYKLLYDSNCKLLKHYFDKILSNNLQSFEKLYFEKDSSFRGLRHS